MRKRKPIVLLLAFLMLMAACPVMPVEAAEPKWVWPVSDQTMRQCYKAVAFGTTKAHQAIDISAPYGTPIVAALDGEVICANYSYKGQYDNKDKLCPGCGLPPVQGYNPGNHVWLKHSDNLYTLYLHLADSKKNIVSAKQKVQAGGMIGRVGNTGYSLGNHLHFSVYSKPSIKTAHFDPLEAGKLDLFRSVKVTALGEDSAAIQFSLFNTYDPLVYGVEYGLSPNQLNRNMEKKNGEGHLIKTGEIKLEKGKLKPGTEYFYRLYYTTPYNRHKGHLGKYYSKVYSFVTEGKSIEGPLCPPPAEQVSPSLPGPPVEFAQLSGRVDEEHRLILYWTTKQDVSPESVEIVVLDNPQHHNPSLPFTSSYRFQKTCPPPSKQHSHTSSMAFYDVGIPYTFRITMVVDGLRYESPLGSFTNQNRSGFVNFASNYFADGDIIEEGDFVFSVKGGSAFLLGLRDAALDKYCTHPPVSLTLPSRCGSAQVVGAGGNLAINTLAEIIEVPEGYRVLDCGLYVTDGIILRALHLPASLCYLHGQFLSVVSHVDFAKGNDCYAVQAKNIVDLKTGAIIAGSGTGVQPALETIENGAYSHQNIPYMVIPGSVKTIGEGAFTWLMEDNVIVISPGTVSIGRNAFSFVDGSLTLTIPASVTFIHPEALIHNYETLLIVEKGSYAEQFAKKQGLRCESR